VPLDGGWSPASILNVVVLPAPFIPSKPRHSCFGIPRHRSLTAMKRLRIVPYTCNRWMYRPVIKALLAIQCVIIILFFWIHENKRVFL